MDKQIRQFVKRIRVRLTGQAMINWLQRTLPAGAAVAIMISVISLFIPFYYAPHFEVLALLLSVFSGVGLGIFHAPDLMKCALMADAKGHKERISTALAMADSPNPYAALQKQDAMAAITGFSIRKEFPLRLSIKKCIPLLLLAVLFAGSCFLESPVRQKAQEVHAVKEKAKETVAAIEKVEKGLKEESGLSETELSDLMEQLELSKAEFLKAETQTELLKAQERLAQKLETASTQTDNKTLSDALQKAAQLAQSQQADTREDLIKEAKEALEQASDGTNAEKEQAYEKLSELASALGDNELQKAADNYRDSNYSGQDHAAAQNALQQAQNRLNDQSALAENSGSSGNANSSDGSDPSATASDSASSSNNTDNQNNNSDGNSQNNSGGNNSQGNSSEGNNSQGNSGQGNSGQGGSGEGNNGQGGSGQGGSSQGGSGSNGTTGTNSGTGWNYGSKNGQEGIAKVDESITVPEGELGEDENLTGEANGNDSSTYTQSDQSQTWAGSKVSYGSVSGEYKEKAYQKLDGASYPDRLKDQIRNYFDGLN